MIEAFIHGFVLAIGLILPLGAQNVFVFNQGASQSTFLRVLPVIITAGICDTALIVIAVLGLSMVVFEIPWLTLIIYIIGFLFLIFMGTKIWRDSSNVESEAKSVSGWRQISFAMSASLLNPHALLDTIGVIGTGSLIYQGSAKWGYTLACVLVSWVWFFFLAILGHFLKGMDKEGRVILLLNRLSAIIIFGVAFYFGWMMISTVFK